MPEKVEIESDAWLSHEIGYPVFRVALPPADLLRNDPVVASASVREHAAARAAAMYYAKVPTCDVWLVRELASNGFYVVDVSVTFSLAAATTHMTDSQAASSTIHVSEIGPAERDGVLEIARETFRYSRFHLDPLIPRSVADQLKHDWILSYVEKRRGDRLFVASVEECPAGFLAACVSGADAARTATIDLMGVNPQYQRRGVGSALVETFFRCYRDECAQFQVGTQAANIPSMRLYEQLGFSVSGTTYVLHMHVHNGSPAGI